MGLAKSGDRPGATPFHAVLLKHRDVAYSEDDLRATVAELVEGRRQLGHIGRVAYEYRRHAWAEPHIPRRLGRGSEQQPGILMIDLVGAVARVVAELVGDLDRIEKLAGRLLWQHLEAREHAENSIGSKKLSAAIAR